jgi:organic radical activating enzyme
VDNLPIAEPSDYYNKDLIMLTGGEPMLKPDLVFDTVEAIRKRTTAKIVLYTAHTKRVWALIAMFHLFDGITLTLHEQSDVEPFKRFNTLLLRMHISYKSLRLNVFKGVELDDSINLKLWEIKDHIEWIDNCPLPEGEVIKRLGVTL